MSNTSYILNSVFSLYSRELKLSNLIKILEKDFVKPKTMIVFSHLRWEFVKQRPQHLLERMATEIDVIFVEEPIAFQEHEYGTAHTFIPYPRLTVIQPKIDKTDFESLQDVIYTYTNFDKQNKPVLWFYSPSFVAMSSLLPKSLVVYDCMDELTQFKGAPPELITQEKALLSQADLVFTGGRSLYETKRNQHDAVYCFPSSVDEKHFAKATKKSTKLPADVAKIKGKKVGFYGVIDERLDLDLLEKTAKLLPKVQFLMIGPVVKISETDLPKRANIHYLGSKNYERLPAYLKSFDVAFMPFALNKATEFISPTKTLEFMAAYKPIISTGIRDVKKVYKKEVKVVKTPQQMATAITAYLKETDKERAARVELQKAVLKQTSWDKTASQMKQLIAVKIHELATTQDAEQDYYKGNSSLRVSV